MDSQGAHPIGLSILTLAGGISTRHVPFHVPHAYPPAVRWKVAFYPHRFCGAHVYGLPTSALGVLLNICNVFGEGVRSRSRLLLFLCSRCLVNCEVPKVVNHTQCGGTGVEQGEVGVGSSTEMLFSRYLPLSSSPFPYVFQMNI